MSSDHVLIEAIKMAQRLLWQNLAPTHKLHDATTVMRFRDLVRSPAIQSALERSSDTFAAFTLRATVWHGHHHPAFRTSALIGIGAACPPIGPLQPHKPLV